MAYPYIDRNTKSLNQLQSKCFEVAYKSNINMLVCAPTGAGKTNVAMMSILHELEQHIEEGVLQRDLFKIVYVAPMKALAQEVVAKFSQRLAPLNIVVKVGLSITLSLSLSLSLIKQMPSNNLTLFILISLSYGYVCVYAACVGADG